MNLGAFEFFFMTIKLTNRLWLFLIFATVLVAIPFLLALLTYASLWTAGTSSGKALPLTMNLFIPLSYYYMPLLVIVGEPFFIGGIGIGPTGWMGVTIAAFFYLAISCIPTFIVSPPGDDVTDALVKKTALWVGTITSLCASAYCYYGIRLTLRTQQLMQETFGTSPSPGVTDFVQARVIKWAIATALFVALAILFIFLLRKLQRTQHAH